MLERFVCYFTNFIINLSVFELVSYCSIVFFVYFTIDFIIW